MQTEHDDSSSHSCCKLSYLCSNKIVRTPPNKYWSVPNHFVCMMSGFKCNPVRPGTCHKLMVLGILVKRAFHSCGDMVFGCVYRCRISFPLKTYITDKATFRCGQVEATIEGAKPDRSALAKLLRSNHLLSKWTGQLNSHSGTNSR